MPVTSSVFDAEADDYVALVVVVTVKRWYAVNVVVVYGDCGTGWLLLS